MYTQDSLMNCIMCITVITYKRKNRRCLKHAITLGSNTCDHKSFSKGQDSRQDLNYDLASAYHNICKTPNRFKNSVY